MLMLVAAAGSMKAMDNEAMRARKILDAHGIPYTTADQTLLDASRNHLDKRKGDDNLPVVKLADLIELPNIPHFVDRLTPGTEVDDGQTIKYFIPEGKCWLGRYSPNHGRLHLVNPGVRISILLQRGSDPSLITSTITFRNEEDDRQQ